VTLSLTGLICISAHQFLRLRTLQKEYYNVAQSSSQLQECLTEKRRLKEQATTLRDQNAKITRIREKPKNPAQLLELLMQATTSGISYHSIEQKKKNLHVVLFSPNTNAVLSYIKQLSSHPLFKHIELQSLEPIDKQVKATFDATLS
jgi:Tfp pilus assembly protein PilN